MIKQEDIFSSPKGRLKPFCCNINRGKGEKIKNHQTKSKHHQTKETQAHLMRKARRVGIIQPGEGKPPGVPYCDLHYLNMAYKKDGEKGLYQPL